MAINMMPARFCPACLVIIYYARRYTVNGIDIIECCLASSWQRLSRNFRTELLQIHVAEFLRHCSSFSDIQSNVFGINDSNYGRGARLFFSLAIRIDRNATASNRDQFTYY